MARGSRTLRSALAGHGVVTRVPVPADSALDLGWDTLRSATREDLDALMPLLGEFWTAFTGTPEMGVALVNTVDAETAWLSAPTGGSAFLETVAEDISQALGYPYGSYLGFGEFTCTACGSVNPWRARDGMRRAGYTPTGLVCLGCLPPRDAAHPYGFLGGFHDPVRWMLAALRAHAVGDGPPPLTPAQDRMVRERILGEVA